MKILRMKKKRENQYNWFQKIYEDQYNWYQKNKENQFNWFQKIYEEPILKLVSKNKETQY